MEIHEYQAKALLRKFEIKTLPSQLAKSSEEAFKIANEMPSPNGWVLKAQVKAGGRGLAGGIKKATNPLEVKKIAKSMIGQNLVTAQTGLKGQTILKLLVEKMCEIKKEFYLALLLDRSTQKICLVASKEGGVSIEEVAEKSPEKILKMEIDPALGLLSFQVMTLLKALSLPPSFFKQLDHFLNSLYKLMMEKESLLIEINPLVCTKEGELLPLDAKMSFDDNSLFRQEEIKSLMDLKDLPLEEQKAKANGLSFVKMSGNIACMVNGAGLAMATMDIISLKGESPANFLDVGGGVDKEKIDIAFKLLKEDPRVQGILVNIFGGIVRCDLIAEGLIKAIQLLEIKVPVVVRLEGTNAKKAHQILENSGTSLSFADKLDLATEKIISLVNKKKL